MYRSFYNLALRPFHITPDPEFLFLSPSHREALASIIYGIEQRKGFISIFGEVGVGKTTILHSYLHKSDHSSHKLIYIFNSAISYKGLLKQILGEFGVIVAYEDSFELVDKLHHVLIEEYKNNRNVILIIDEAQNMPIETLESLRMLSNLETSEDKLIQILMLGQPEFEQILNRNELRQLRQRIAVRCTINPLSEEESLAYVQHRLAKASSHGTVVFAEGALKTIIKEARGIPRMINILCDNALITGFGYQKRPINRKIVREVVRGYMGKSRVRWWRWVLASFLIVAAILLFATTPHMFRGEVKDRKGLVDGEVGDLSSDKEPAKKLSGVRANGGDSTAVAGESSEQAISSPPTGLPSVEAVPDWGGPASSSIPPETKSSPAKVDRRTNLDTQAVSGMVEASEARHFDAVTIVVPLEGRAPHVIGLMREGMAVSAARSNDFQAVNPGLPVAATSGVGMCGDCVEFSAPKSETASSPAANHAQENDPIIASGTLDSGTNWRIVEKTVKKGDSLTGIIVEEYGQINAELMDQVIKLNPQIKSINVIKVGDKVFLRNLKSMEQLSRR